MGATLGVAVVTGVLAAAGLTVVGIADPVAAAPPNSSLERLSDGLRAIADVTVSGDLVYFTADDKSVGRELWRTDGTREGTELVKDINPTIDASPRLLTDVGGRLFFTARDDIGAHDLWTSDGTEEGTTLVREIGVGGIYGLTEFGDTLLFAADDPDTGPEPWISDGTTAGTRVLRDIKPGTNGSFPSSFTISGGAAYFAAAGVDANTELWSTNGTSVGTRLVRDISPVDGSHPRHLADVNGTLFFAAGTTLTSGGSFDEELWRSDGTAVGTRLVRDVNEFRSSQPRALTAVADRVFFRALKQRECEACGRDELFVSDGTASGTQLVRETNPLAMSNPGNLIAFDDRLFFTAWDRDTRQDLWASDGTQEGTAPFADINPGGGSNAGSLTVLDERLYFRADDGVDGVELWSSDGTSSGTVSVADVRPGPASSDPRELTAFGSDLVFLANDETDDDTDAQLWVLREDEEDPDTAITSGPAPGQVLTRTRARFEFSGTSGDTAAFQCSLNDAQFVTCPSPLTLRRIPNGRYVIRARAVDHLGRLDPTPATRRFEVSSNAFTTSSRVGRLKKSGRVRIRLTLPGPGKLVARGKGSPVKTLRKRIYEAGTHRVTLSLTKRGQQQLRRTRAERRGPGRLQARVKLSYTPVGGSTRHKTRRYVFKLK